MDGACRAEFTIYLWITAVQTFFAHVDVMLETGITGFFIRVIGAKFHILIIQTKCFEIATFTLRIIAG